MVRFRSRGIALVVAMSLGLVGCGSEGKAVSESTGLNNTDQGAAGRSESEGDSTSPSTAEEELPASPRAEQTTTTAPSKPNVEITESGFSTYITYDDSERATAGATLENVGGQKAVFIEVIFTFKDETGKPVATDSSYVYAIDPGGVGYAVVDRVQLPSAADTVDVAAITDESSIMDGIVVPLGVEGVSPPQYGDGVEVRGTAENPSQDVLESVTVTCVLRSGGKIVGGASGHLNTLVPGGSIAWTASGSVSAESAECAGSKFG